MVGVDCKEAREMLSSYLDNEVTGRERAALDRHFQTCLPCSHELAEMERVVAALRQLGRQEFEVPENFSGAVMSRINNERIYRFNFKFKYLKQVAAGAAAALLLAAGSWFIGPGQLVKIADAPQQTDTANYIQPDASLNHQLPSTSGNPEAVANGGSSETAPKPGDSTEPEVNPETGGGSGQTSPIEQGGANITQFVSVDKKVIVSTFVKLQVGESSEDVEKTAIDLARAKGFSVQKLGQQNISGKLCLVDKFAGNASSANELIASLERLGSLLSYQDVTEDITQRYSELYSELLSLQNQHSQAASNVQAEQLEQQIEQIRDQLQSLDKQASTQTIVLWLQQ